MDDLEGKGTVGEKEKEETLGEEDEKTLDTDSTDDDKSEEEVEEWMRDGDDETDQTGLESIPLHAHIRAKRKLKGRISEKDGEIESLKVEIEKLKSAKPTDKLELPKRPRRDAFETDDEYEDALDKYEDEKDNIKFNQLQQSSNIRSSQEKAAKRIEHAVDTHYERAGKLLESSGITAEAFKAADQSVREAVETIMPKMGDAVVDQFISRLGEGSEKVFFRLGRSKALMGEFIGLLASDPSGLDAATFLGQQKAMLLNTTKRKSNAPSPDTQLSGGESAGEKGGVLKRRYQEAHKKGKGQEAWNAKREAKAAGIDVSGW